jgi:exodeoxyribonuclease VII large subunit
LYNIRRILAKGNLVADAYSVKKLNTYLAEWFDSNELLQDIWVEGEVSNMKRAASGHWYFTLKEGDTQLKSVMWRTYTERQHFRPNDGDKVLAHGRVGVYDVQGVYQLYADSVQQAGVGDLYAEFERLKAQLMAEGLFDAERKRPIPAFPRRIGVVTSAEAAAFQDIQNVLRRRFPLAEVLLSATPVQGADAPPNIVKALERLNQHGGCDVILVVRGGGSIEDLWAFNDEGVARAIAASRTPVICGVGHETDTTIADFAADLRAPTPSAAAELATPDRAELRAAVRDLNDALFTHIDDTLSSAAADLNSARRTMGHLSPAVRIRSLRQQVDDRAQRLSAGQAGRLGLLRERVATRRSALHNADPRAILKRGYAIVSRSEDGAQMESSKGVMPGTGISIQFHDGELKARVEDKDSHERYKRTLF